jgi:hypothetical protein
MRQRLPARILIRLPDMDDDITRTVETSLEMLSEAVGKATEDLDAAQGVIAGERTNAASLDALTSREVIAAAKHTIDHLRHADESLRVVISLLGSRNPRA